MTRSLTATEYETLRLAATGLTFDEIAHVRGISRDTVKNCLGMVRLKLDVPSTIHAFILMGWLVPPEGTRSGGTRT